MIFGAPTYKSTDKPAFHPLHVSTTDISFNPQDKKLEVICTIFTDDFEAVLAKQYHAKTDLSDTKVHAAMDKLVKDYVDHHVQLKNAATAIKLNYLGFEKVKEVVNVYLESDTATTPKRVDGSINLLYDLYTDQMNIVHITVNGKRKSTKIDYPETQVSQTF
ncbi:hypothetical protein LJ707_03365 [Mucilaginibacter sp. UR6-1]|uniref:DUF6702 family protein n=1 Tax=Mucilaginibacter sp. UR6-1 TaxID=1435643 RepID=UPI001E4BECB4|nr:DUF6702 family protein [Mucilaginibacter sp. UR6-1]MCC8407952.1 hypothetical protein [Mucilaginibacter sp. UR6-1]